MIAVALMALCVSSAFGQSPFSQSSDCSDPGLSYGTDCQAQAQLQDQYQIQNQDQNQRIQPPESQQMGGTQATDASGRGVYVDSGGFPETNNQQKLQQEQQQWSRLERPEPLTDLQRLAQQSTGELLPIFGRELFRTPPSTFAPADQIPASPDYVLGPGDEIILRIWGHDNLNARLTVDRAGSIYIPHLGAVDVAGLRFRDLQAHLKKELSRTYRNFDISVNLGKLRSIQVFVLGEAYSPGSYTVSSLSTIFNALLVSGGPTPQGSLRNVQLRRGGQTIASLDLYNFILHGDRSKDVVLQSGDVIYIPFVGAQVALGGDVRHPAIYEILGTTNVGDLLTEAGGLTSTASAARITIERIEDHHERHAMSVELDHAGLSMGLMDGDVLHVDPILDGYKDTVTIRGNLANPGRFPWHPGMRLSEIIPDRESLLTKDYWRQRNRLGLPTPLFQPSDVEIGANGRIWNQNDERNRLGARGQSNAESGYGTERSVSPNGQVIGREDAEQLDETSRNGMNPQDSMLLNSTSQNSNQNNARPTSGESSLADQQAMSTRNLSPEGRKIEIKVGVSEIDWSYAVVQRLDAKTLRNSLIPFDLGKLVNDHDSSQDVLLQPGDVVTILSQNDINVRQDERTKYVRLEGEFVNSGVYSVLPGETLVDVVRRAGGLTDKAYLYGSSFTRETARVLQQQRLSEYVSSLEANMERASETRALSATTALTTGSSFAEERSLLDQMRSLRATGRVVLQFKPDSTGIAAIPPIDLEDGDTFRVPSRPIIVSVVGAVYGQNVFLYNSRYRVRDYLLLAGKPNRIADKKHAFIVRADGSVFSGNAGGGLWSDHFDDAPIYPGDTVVVPEKPVKPSALRDVIDWSQVFSQFAIGAAAIEVIKTE